LRPPTRSFTGNFQRNCSFWIGDIRDPTAWRPPSGTWMSSSTPQHEAVPTCEYYPYEAVRTNIDGAENIVVPSRNTTLRLRPWSGVSTDKACKPVNVMGMTKALQERIFIQGNMRLPEYPLRVCPVRERLASRGSVIPLFHSQIRSGGPVTITTPEMTRFLLSLHDAVDTIFAAVSSGLPGETYIPRVPSSRIVDLAKVLIDGRPIETVVTGIRPGEKIHEILINEEEASRTADRGEVVRDLADTSEIRGEGAGPGCLKKEYSSMDDIMELEETRQLLKTRRLMLRDVESLESELLR